MSHPTTIEITEDHLRLLERLYIYWDDSMYDGAPAVNIKRPYGNSWVWGDVSEILKIDWDRDDDMTEDAVQQCKAIHEQMADVMQVLVQNPTSFGTGTWWNVHPSAPYACMYRRR